MDDPRSLNQPIVIGIGRSERGDDGVGPYVAAGVKQALGERIEVRCFSEDLFGLVECLDVRRSAVIVDALAPQGRPGRCVAWHGCDELSDDFKPAVSSHVMDLQSAVKLAAALGRCPQDLRIIGIEAQRVSFGEGLSAAVQEAADALIERLVQEWKAVDHGDC